MFVCLLYVCLARKTISCQTGKGNIIKHGHIRQGNCMENVDVWQLRAVIIIMVLSVGQIDNNEYQYAHTTGESRCVLVCRFLSQPVLS